MRALCLTALLFLAGCNSLSRLDAASFEMEASNPEAFERDDDACTQASDLRIGDNPAMADATSYDRNRAYNRLYSDCMIQRGHRPRPYVKNLLPDTGGWRTAPANS